MTEFETVHAIHDILHDRQGGKASRIRTLCIQYSGPESTTINDILAILSDSTGNKAGRVHIECHSYTETFDPGETILTGNIGGTIPRGESAKLSGACTLVADLVVNGTLIAEPTGVVVDGQGLYQILVEKGGVLLLEGVEKTAWTNWGGAVVGWEVDDRLAVAPTAAGVYEPIETTWAGTWAGTTRPPNTADVTMADTTVVTPEVVNLSQTLLLKNLTRIHIHDSPVPASQTLRWLKVLDSGKTGELSFYPIHFHLLGNTSIGSQVEGVVVEGGKNHAFVPHGSNGISFPNCAAYNTTGVAFWWDLPPGSDDTTNDSNDIDWNDCLSMWSKPSVMPGESFRLAGFWLGAGQNVRCSRSVATCVQGNASSGPRSRSGFHWPENASRTSWDFKNSVAHNNVENGLFVWQNAGGLVNVLEDFVAYRNGVEGINHGAYVSDYQYRGAVLTGDGLIQHAKSQTLLLFTDIVSDSPLKVVKHNSTRTEPTFFRNCTFSSVIYTENQNGSYNVFEDCELEPADFTLTSIADESIIEVYEGGVLTHRWASGAWS